MRSWALAFSLGFERPEMLTTYNIANGLTVGLILHPLLKLAAGRGAEIKPGSVVLALACLVYYLFGLPH
jgi:adenine/guanine/hypoxanthine permease